MHCSKLPYNWGRMLSIAAFRGQAVCYRQALQPKWRPVFQFPDVERANSFTHLS
jgi:hypothetical protein